MFKPVYATSGVLITGVSALANIFALSSGLYASLSAILGEAGSDYTYVLITDGINNEVARIDQLNDGLATVTRAQDSTTADAYGAGATVTPIIPSIAISEMITAAIDAASLPASLSFVINDPHTVVEDAGVVTIDIVKLPLTSPNATIDVTTVDDGYGIDIQRGAFGCCPEDD